jgi:CRP/FNR family cyclic AMP-dependent transcriptional regulator
MKIQEVFKAANAIRELPAGTVLFESGDKGEEMFGVVSGEIDLRLPDGGVLKVGPDDTFGEMAVVDGSPRSATAVAVVDTSVAVIDKRTFLFLVHETPMFALEVMAKLANRLRASPGA